MLYDGLIILALMMLAAALALPITKGEHIAFQDPLFTLYLMSIWFAYFAWCWKRMGQTLGMRVWRIHLVTETEGGFSVWSCLLRFVGAFISAAAAGLGYLWSFFDKKKRCWHDMLSKSQLIYRPK